ncbi:uncharacterized protein CCR75_006067 [Bremia lactucae]|uniref:PX domain-containing protein n=1 Tax=Bremia lactucae TaxID=4779 RepID=A0A976IAS3_BRELC|nr:hypothetical protein CCR75_006067 [Bremia lactucae]
MVLYTVMRRYTDFRQLYTYLVERRLSIAGSATSISKRWMNFTSETGAIPSSCRRTSGVAWSVAFLRRFFVQTLKSLLRPARVLCCHEYRTIHRLLLP